MEAIGCDAYRECGEDFDFTDGSATSPLTIKSNGFDDGEYDPDQNCHWIIKAPGWQIIGF